MTRFLPLAAAAALLLSACTGRSLDARRELAAEIAARAHMTPRVIEAGLFNLATWERLDRPGAPVRVYIEGDGRAWLSRNEISPNPTPLDPVALRLAAADTADNVVYIARPCQYERWRGEGPCPEKYWTRARAAPEVIAACQAALDGLKARGHDAGFELVGYSGGAAVAALAAAGRRDVLSLRTVAGNLDHGAFAALHGVSPLSESLEPVSAAPALSKLPQVHFMGERDTVVPHGIFESWKAASGASPCVRGEVVAGNDHYTGWPGKWPELLARQPSCDNAPTAP